MPRENWQVEHLLRRAAFGPTAADLVTFGDAPVSTLILQRLPVTLWLAAYSTVIALLISVPLATYSALHKNGFVDQGVRTIFLLTFAMPPFWVGLLLMLFFGLTLKWFPVSGLGEGFVDRTRHLLLPSVTIALFLAPIVVHPRKAQQLRAGRGFQRARARGVIDVRVRAEYPFQATFHRLQQRGQVRRALRTGIDQGEISAPDDVSIGSGTGHDARIGRGDACYPFVQAHELARHYFFPSVHHAPFIDRVRSIRPALPGSRRLRIQALPASRRVLRA